MSKKYIGIRLEGLEYWLWFKYSDVEDGPIEFCGKDGWGKGGCEVDVAVNSRQILGRIYSDELHFKK